jgi:nucleotide-binding universal stress UspA family protein
MEVVMSAKMKLLVGYDGSSCADCALDDLQRAGLPREAEAVVLSVAELWLAPPSVRQSVKSGIVEPVAAGVKPALHTEDALEEAHALSIRASERLKSHFAAWEVFAEAASGSPAREILKKANEWKPDLIVLGCQGKSGLGRFLLGSVSQKVANEAHCSVRIARGTAWKNGAPVRIVIGLDGSPGSQATAAAVALRAWPMGSEARIIAVEDPGRPVEVNQQEGRAWVREFVEAAAKQLRAAELAVSCKIETGDPKQIIIIDAEEWGADCIFLGSSSLNNGARNYTLGSVATAVVARAHCSVEIVR